MPVKLTKVEIGDFRYSYKFRLENGNIVEVMILGVNFDALLGRDVIIPEYPSATFIGATKHIGFDSPPRSLADKEYSTQPNGYHWVKIAGYAMIKIAPEYIVNGTLSNAGVTLIQTESVAE